MASPKKSTSKKSTAKKSSAVKKTVGKKAVARKKSANKSGVKKTTAKSPVKKKSSAKKSAPIKAGKKSKSKSTAKAPAKLTPKQREAARKALAREKEAARKAAAKAKEAARKEAAKQKELARKEAIKKKEAAKKEAALIAAAKKAEKEAARAAKEAAKQAAKIVIPPPPAVQVINPIGGDTIPQVRKAVPGKKAAPKRPVVEEDESKWTKTELNQVRKILLKEVAELDAEIAAEEARFHALIVESGEGAGDDQADAGAKTFEREHEISILSNKKDLLDQSHHALERIEAGTYGFCENCGKPIGKLRLLEANPRATLCMPCREREDRS